MNRIAPALAIAVAAAMGAWAVKDDAPAAGHWRMLPTAPLSPRTQAVLAWTGSEVVVAGGSIAPPCPPGAACTGPREPVADGAAFDPSGGTWRRIADAPVAFDSGQAVALGGDVYLWASGPSAAFLVYRPATDRWEQFPAPSDLVAGRLAVVGGSVVAYSSTDEKGEQPDRVFDAATRTWTALPDDPLPPSFDRTLLEVGRHIVLLAAPVADATGPGPVLQSAALYDPRARTWERLPTSRTLAQSLWFADGTRVVAPVLGTANGGEVNGWGRDVPFGGVLDTATHRWGNLPPGPAAEPAVGAGVVSRSAAGYNAISGWLLDLDRDQWQKLPAGPVPNDASVVAAGRTLFAFGGSRFETDAAGKLSREGAMWEPPAPA